MQYALKGRQVKVVTTDTTPTPPPHPWVEPGEVRNVDILAVSAECTKIMASSDSSGGGGFEFNFIGDVKDFECPLCLHVTREPNLTSCCGQHFCGSCINRIITDRKPCPFCKERRFSVLLDKKQKRKVLELEVECSERNKNCTWTGKLSDLDAHVNDECRYVNVACPRGCGTEVQRWMLDKHTSNSCPNRLYVCRYCRRKDTYQLITTEHFPKCPKYPVHCPNNCTIKSFKREVLNDHITQDCPLQQVDCEYKCFGCSAVVVRRVMASTWRRIPNNTCCL